MTAVACCGLQLYRMGETVSIPLWDDCGCPDSFYPKIVSNYCRGLHTLCLLDIKVSVANYRLVSFNKFSVVCDCIRL